MIVPVFPSLFGEPYPRGHPWAGGYVHRGWGHAPRIHLIVDYKGRHCTSCRRGLGCGKVCRVTANPLKPTCCNCIRATIKNATTASLRGENPEFFEGPYPYWYFKHEGPSAIAFWRSHGAFLDDEDLADDSNTHRGIPTFIRRFFVVVADPKPVVESNHSVFSRALTNG